MFSCKTKCFFKAFGALVFFHYKSFAQIPKNSLAVCYFVRQYFCLPKLQVLEMVCSVVPEVFTDWSRSSAELTLTRLFQVNIICDWVYERYSIIQKIIFLVTFSKSYIFKFLHIILCDVCKNTATGFCLTYFQPMFHFYTPPLRKHQKTFDFLMFSGGKEVEHWLEMG